MPYTKTNWVDEVPAGTPVKYKFTDDVLGIVASSAKIEVVTPITIPGTGLNAANMNKIEAALEDATNTAESALAMATATKAVANNALLYALPVIYVVKNTTQAIAQDTYTSIAGWNTPVIVASGYGFNATTGQINIPAGKYIVRIQARWDVNSTGIRQVSLRGSTGVVGIARPALVAPVGVVGHVIGDLHVVIAASLTTFVEGWQNSGGTLNLSGASLEIRRIGD